MLEKGLKTIHLYSGMSVMDEYEFPIAVRKVREDSIESITNYLAGLKGVGYRDGIAVSGVFTFRDGKYFLDGEEVDQDGLMMYLSDSGVGDLVKMAIKLATEVEDICESGEGEC